MLLVHLSDIHFHYKWSGHAYDRDEHVRDDLEDDLRRMIEVVGKATALIVTGDLAFQGSKEEFGIARDWLERVAAIAGCGSSNVLVIPGNHDVSQTVIKQNDFIREFQKSLCADAASLDGTMQCLLNDEIKGPLLFKSLEEYGQLAENYGCFSTPQSPFWERLYPIDGSTLLRVRGVNSAIASSHEDGQVPARQLAVGSWQARMRRDPGVVNMLLCHHPPSWLADEEKFNSITQANLRAIIQLFGHEHELQIDPNENWLRIHAGAVHPSRSEPGWLPRYNLIGIDTDEVAGVKTLRVLVWPRAWKPEDDAFGGDESLCEGVEPFKWARPLSVAVGMAVNDDVDPVFEHEQGDPPTIARNHLTSEQRLVGSFVRLPQQDIIALAVDLGLTEEGDLGQPRQELLRRYFERSRARPEGLKNLWTAVAARAAELNGVDNPFEEDQNG